MAILNVDPSKEAKARKNIEVSSGFGGLYARKDWANHWIKAIVAGGYAHHDSQRQVAAAAVQTARAKYDGYFVMPGLSAGARLAQPSENHSLWGSVRVHYGGLFLDEWEGTPNCVSGVAFLKAFNEGRMKVTADKVVCVGGGV